MNFRGAALGDPRINKDKVRVRHAVAEVALQLTAIAACCAPDAVAEAAAGARRLAVARGEMVAGLRSAGVEPVDGNAPFVLFAVPDAELMRKHLHARGIAVRRCDTFVGLDGQYLRAAVLPEWAREMYGYTAPLLTPGRREEIRQVLGVLDAVFLGEPGVLEARQRITARIRSAQRA